MHLYFTLFLKRSAFALCFSLLLITIVCQHVSHFFFYRQIALPWVHILYLFTVFALMDFFSSFQSFAITNRTAMSSIFTEVLLCFCHYVFVDDFQRWACGSEQVHQQLCSRHCSRPPQKSEPFRISTSTVGECLYCHTLTRRICCQNVGFLLVCWVRNCISILICISFIMRRLEIVSCLLRAFAFFF